MSYKEVDLIFRFSGVWWIYLLATRADDIYEAHFLHERPEFLKKNMILVSFLKKNE